MDSTQTCAIFVHLLQSLKFPLKGSCMDSSQKTGAHEELANRLRTQRTINFSKQSFAMQVVSI